MTRHCLFFGGRRRGTRRPWRSAAAENGGREERRAGGGPEARKGEGSPATSGARAARVTRLRSTTGRHLVSGGRRRGTQCPCRSGAQSAGCAGDRAAGAREGSEGVGGLVSREARGP